MVKGISKKIVLVSSPDKKLFEQAIFIVSDNFNTDQDVLDRAYEVAEGYVKNNKKHKGVKFFISGAILSLLLNILFNLIF